MNPGLTGTMEKIEKKRDLVQSVIRAFHLLELISKEQPVHLSELARKAGLKKTTVARLTGTLRATGMIDQDPQDKTFALTIRAVELGSRVLNKINVRRLGRPLVETFVSKYGVSLLVGVLDRNEVIYIDKLTAPEAFRISMTVGERVPAYCSGSGKAILAFLDPGERRDILMEAPLPRITRQTLTDIEELEKNLAETRKRGYALDLEERIEGVVSAGAPIFGPNKKVSASISVPRMRAAISDAELSELGKRVARLAQDVSQLTGWGNEDAFQTG